MFGHLTSSQLLRRDFLVGGAAGFAATRSIGWIKGGSHEDPEAARPSYAQCGEDRIVQSIFEYLNIDRPSYLDIGAYLPIFSSNTFLFYASGSRGVLVEPNLDLIPELKAKRPRDTVLNVGVGVSDQGAADYFRMTLPQWNTFDGDEARRRAVKTKGKVKIEQVVKMPLVPINRIIADHFPGKDPEFLSIDVESLDLSILRTLDFQRFRPKVICTETLVHMTARMDLGTTEFLSRQGYHARAMTFANTIYVDRTLLD
ncbi:MAG: FkbM family methyltransferase [Singulisphaera sp.]